MTIVCVTHEMGLAKTVADCIIFTGEGKILERAQPSGFSRSPRHERT